MLGFISYSLLLVIYSFNKVVTREVDAREEINRINCIIGCHIISPILIRCHCIYIQMEMCSITGTGIANITQKRTSRNSFPIFKIWKISHVKETNIHSTASNGIFVIHFQNNKISHRTVRSCSAYICTRSIRTLEFSSAYSIYSATCRRFNFDTGRANHINTHVLMVLRGDCTSCIISVIAKAV